MKNNQRFDYSALAELLGQRGLVEPERLAVALQTCAQSGFPFPDLLVDNGLITDWEIGRVVAEFYGLPFLPVESYTPDPHATEGLDMEFLALNKIIPMERHGQLLTVCMPVLVPAEVLGILSAQTGLSVLPIVGTVSGNRTWFVEQQTAAAKSAQPAAPKARKAEEVEAALPGKAAADPEVEFELEEGEAREPADDGSPATAEDLDEWSSLFDEADAAVHIALEETDDDADPDEAPPQA